MQVGCVPWAEESRHTKLRLLVIIPVQMVSFYGQYNCQTQFDFKNFDDLVVSVMILTISANSANSYRILGFWLFWLFWLF